MQKFDIFTSRCVPLPIEDIDTDQIIPARFLKATTREGFGDNLFRDWRYDSSGKPVPTFPLNDPTYSGQVLVAGKNFGCGSSREHAAWAIAGYGFRAVISSFFADIHKNNELNNFVLPVQVSDGFLARLFDSIAKDAATEVKIDLPAQTITNMATGESEQFDINPYKKQCLMEGLDDVDYLLRQRTLTESWESTHGTPYKKNNMHFNIAVLPGDGIGPEISKQGVDVMSAVCRKFGHTVNYEYALCGAAAIDAVGDPFPEETYQLCRRSDAVLFSAVGHPKYDNDPNAKVRPEQGLLAMRKRLGLYANIRPVETFKCLLHNSPLRAELLDGADFICIRELTGGMYFGEKYEDDFKAFDTNLYTRPEIERILRVAYDYAMRRRKKLTVVDKANVLASSRLWRKVAQEVAKEYPEVQTEYMFVDNAAMRMIQEPRHFDVMVTENTFGDILTDEGSVISGSMGLLPSASTGESTPVFEPVHGSWPQAAGQNIANPIAQILSVAMLFEYFGLMDEGRCIRDAVNASLDANVRTPEIQVPGGAVYGTKEVGEWIVNKILS